MIYNRDSLIRHAQNSIAKGSKSFAMASRLFDQKTREHVWLLYAWCRKCDDLADGQDHGGDMAKITDAQTRLEYIRALTTQAFAGQPTGDPSFDALALVASETGITAQMADAVIDGFALDAAEWRPREEDDMLQYCYHVAGAVGVMMAVVMGVSPNDRATLDRACDLGMAFQLANIARDIEEDDAAGRCYLPIIWLVEMDIEPGQHMKPHYRPRLSILARKLCDMSEQYEQSARIGAQKLPFRARWAVLAAAGIYGDIARKVRSAGDHAWDHRISTTKFEKLRWLIKSCYSASNFSAGHNNPPMQDRKGLWTRP
ncbi:phytoene synthase [Sphingorhabdus lutea]|uniref:Phytoene synthase n=1 Tax=Sphingorhabdus lutea TaxID=1913578 RepID=A0A1L3J911_9SPHN|nr:phytoene/squalene synthase family protein [Sphingorhabdus lutea]APG61626.1 phytoene synthase [Sphingorhabdus lutea]